MLIELDELAAYLPDTRQDPERSQLLLDLTAALVYSEVPQGIADGSLLAKGVALEVAARAFRNAEGYSMESVDDYTYRRDTGTRAPGVYLTGDERATLQKLLPAPRPRARSQKLRVRLPGVVEL